MAVPYLGSVTSFRVGALVGLSLLLAAGCAPIPFYCRLNEIQCPSQIKSCVRLLGICNGINDCPDGSDEAPELCKNYTCTLRDYELGVDVPYFRTSQCPSGNMCTKKYTFEFNPEEEDYQTFFKCTGGPKECADGSDEDPRYCKNLDCTQGEFGYWAATCPSKKYCLYPVCDRCGELGKDRLCDGSKDCPDGSDEWPSFCKANGCSYLADQSFRCKDGGCVKTRQICNGVNDCADGSDELASFCKTYACPWTEGKKCKDGRTCIASLQICDGKKNCPDGSDEDPLKCRPYVCPKDTWKCKDGLQCAYSGDPLSPTFLQEPRCNNVYDCNDKSDESSAVCKPFNCGEFSKKCPGNSACIWTYGLCDGKKDCLDGSDETSALCKTYKCDSNFQVKCTSTGICTKGTLCDGRVDCDDKSDEDPAFCQAYKCRAGWSKCPKFPYQCIPDDRFCDGKKRCIDNSDEDPKFCKTFVCPGTTVNCNGKCQDGRPCDGQRDCADGSDESASFCKAYKCPKDFEKCKDGKQCVNFYDLCRFDGRSWAICNDRSESDPAFCSKYDCGASQGTGFFKCTANSTQCFDVVRRCDGKVDCPSNKADEKSCKEYKCPEDYIKCPDQLQCIYLGKYCDGKPDCAGGAEEEKNFCTSYKCPIVRGVQFIKCPDKVRCTDPAIPC